MPLVIIAIGNVDFCIRAEYIETMVYLKPSL